METAYSIISVGDDRFYPEEEMFADMAQAGWRPVVLPDKAEKARYAKFLETWTPSLRQD